ncbi:glycosyltransferase [Reichenbachiella carrageenanivorans]|uniref:Glycosyltransferase n=1 Tax=Reichenbachiella carrageenanivorans TaxID=2979869 RepID=A0ABY6D355_9BACT|nr:glycosyltransferase family 2 protein [Reichenbachiella carrageenanivorans]UXX80592.1 glycosyltransferase [Reichenbachiella carrageenanivorans]
MMNKQALISIITPVYNIDQFLNETIQSVVNQTYINWELFLIDDNSNDKSRSIIKSWASKDKRIKPIYLDENVGAGRARNYGLDQVKGEYLAFLDSDDVWVKDKLTKQVNFLINHPKVSFSFTWYTTINEHGIPLKLFLTPSKIGRPLLKFNNYILTSSIMCKTSVVKNIRFPRMRRRQDWAYFLDVLKKTKYAYSLPESTVLYRKTKGSLSANRWKLIRPNYDFFRETIYSSNRILAVIHFLFFLPFYFHNKLFNSKNLKN